MSRAPPGRPACRQSRAGSRTPTTRRRGNSRGRRRSRRATPAAASRSSTMRRRALRPPPSARATRRRARSRRRKPHRRRTAARCRAQPRGPPEVAPATRPAYASLSGAGARRPGGSGLGALDQQGMDLAAVGAQYLEGEIVDDDRLAALGQAAKARDHETADGVEVLIRERGAEALVEVRDLGHGLHAVAAAAVDENVVLGLVEVELVL